MSKVIKSSSKERPTNGWSYVFGEYQRDFMKGRLCTLLESFGLKETQEKAAKDIIKQEVDSWFFPNALGINGELSTAIHGIVYEVNRYKESQSAGMPTQSGDFEFEIIATEK